MGRISVMDEDMWRGLCTIAGLEDLQRDRRYQTLAGRLAHQDDLDDTVSKWTERFTPWEAASELQAVGVAAAPGRQQLGRPPRLATRGPRLLPCSTARALRRRAQLRAGHRPLRDRRSLHPAAPAFGEDTRDILRDVAGLDDDEIQAAIDSGIAHPMTHPHVHLKRLSLHWIGQLMPSSPWPASTVDPARILYDAWPTSRASLGSEARGPST